jgi:predicted GNAT superfamily acetyltransferase
MCGALYSFPEGWVNIQQLNWSHMTDVELGRKKNNLIKFWKAGKH